MLLEHMKIEIHLLVFVLRMKMLAVAFEMNLMQNLWVLSAVDFAFEMWVLSVAALSVIVICDIGQGLYLGSLYQTSTNVHKFLFYLDQLHLT